MEGTLDYELPSAAEANDAKRIQELVAEGADVDACGAFGMRPLHRAALMDASATVQELIKFGADVEAADSSGSRPLHWAALRGATNATRILVRAGADVNAADALGRAPSHVAASFGHKQTVRFLLGAGADPQLRDNNGKTPLQLARDKGPDPPPDVLLEKVDRRDSSQFALTTHCMTEDKVPDKISSQAPKASISPWARGLSTSRVAPSENLLLGQSQIVQQSQAHCTNQVTTAVDAQPRLTQPVEHQSRFLESGPSLVCPFEEPTDEVNSVFNLKQGHIFANNFYIHANSINGKPMVYCATPQFSNEEVILKFYAQPELYNNACSIYKILNASSHVCKPMNQIPRHGRFPDCLVFPKGSQTLEEWLHIDDVIALSGREVLQAVATALCELHKNNIVHCDIKPANLLYFSNERKWKLIDMDSALKAGEVGGMNATIAYASPEVLEAAENHQTEIALQTTADMWAYGVIAFEVFTRKPFYGTRETTLELALDFLRSERFEEQLESVKDEKQRHFIKKFLKWNAYERASAQMACASSIFKAGSITVAPSAVSLRSPRARPC